MVNSLQLMEILKDQKERMIRLISNDKIMKRELPFDINSLTLGANSIILGPRRCDKSTFSFDTLKNIKFGYVNFDDKRLNISSENLNDILEAIYSIEGGVEIILFDEIQEVTGWEKFISRLIDEKRIMITGSNPRLLDRDLGKHITGRHINYTLLPFSFTEFLHYFGFETEEYNTYSTNKKAELINLLKKYIEDGGSTGIKYRKRLLNRFI